MGCDAPVMMSTLGSSGVGPAVKLAVSFPLVYHYLGAVRHTVSRRLVLCFRSKLLDNLFGSPVIRTVSNARCQAAVSI